ncbi:outer membrane protein assembly factor BamC [Nitrincola iocasae]|uniref:Outer membrane protein assembly factor BamC n=2 Tax=Nitrincola iocasae TaxID=2614693 RepID=A0A5J6LIQ0_9GAMM|nr:outer membrane protein assembly factor BamC [Nitrincola iocasae]
MNVTQIFALPLMAVVLVLTGCGSVKNPVYGEHGIIRDRSQDYELAEAGQRLEIPANIQARETREQLVVPDVGTTATRIQGRFRAPRPEFFYADPGSDLVNLQRLDGERIIMVDEPIADVWTKVIDFWDYNGVRVARTDPRQGVIETDWIRTEGEDYNIVDRWMRRLTLQTIDGPAENKLRVTVRPDPDNYERTSIRMKHVQYPSGQEPEMVNWDRGVPDISYQSDMMFEMLRYFSRASEPTTARTLLAMEQQRAGRAELGRDSRGNPALRVNAPADRAWGLIDAAFDKAELDVGTRDQQAGIFYMTYTTTTQVEDTSRKGFFDWLFSDREDITIDTSFLSSAIGGQSDDDEEEINYSSRGTLTSAELAEQGEVLTDLNDPNNPANREGYKIWFGGRVIYVFGGSGRGVFNNNTGEYEHVGRYQVNLNRTRSGVMVTVLTEEGIAAPAVVAEEILWQIKDQLPQTL